MMKHNEYKINFWTGACALVFSVIYLIFVNSQISSLTDGISGYSGRTFPRVIGGATIVISVIYMIQNYLGMRKTETIKKKFATDDIERLKRLLYYIFAVALYIIGITYIGYIVSTIIFIAFAMWFTGARLNFVFLIITFILPPTLYIVFHKIMLIPLPHTLLF